MKLKLLFILHFIGFSSLIAQPDQYKFSKIDISNGLSNNRINAIFKDSRGFMWFGTMSGLNRYDGYSLKIFRHNPSDTTSINDSYILKIEEDNQGKLWVRTRSGYCVYDPENEIFSHSDALQIKLMHDFGATFVTSVYKDNKQNFWLVDRNVGLFKIDKEQHLSLINKAENKSFLGITDLISDSKGNLWFINQYGVISCIETKTNKILYTNKYLNQLFIGVPLEYTIYVDRDDELWITAISDAKGIFWLVPKTNSFQHFTNDSKNGRLNTNIVNTIVQANDGNIWIGTDHGGLNILNKKNLAVQYLLNIPDDPKSLNQNSINSIYKDNTGIIWMGTFKKGINYYHENIFKFRLYRHLPSDINSLEFDDIDCFAEDKLGNIWIGTNGGGLVYFNRSLNSFKTFKHNVANSNSISSNIIIKLFIDSENKLWIGTFYGGLDCYDGQTFKHFKYDAKNPTSLSNNIIWDIFEDSGKKLWIGTLGGGLDLFDRKNKEFSHYKTNAFNSVQSNYILALDEDKDKNLWIGTSDGVDVLDHKTGRFLHYSQNESSNSGLSNGNIIYIKVDTRDFIWIGTREGVNVFDKSKNKFIVFRKTDGLPDNTINTILEDKYHNMWIGTPKGLCNIKVSKNAKNEYKFEFVNYDESDGLQGNEFNEHAALCTRNKELIFGGTNGFNLFTPEEIKKNEILPKLVFTDFQIFNKSIKVNEKVNNKIILSKSITESPAITLKFSDNVFSIEFAALSYIHPEKCQYKYILEGFNKEWLLTSADQRKATYTNLDPGEYTFKVKASNNDGLIGPQEASLKIIVQPPFWRTPLAYIIYILMLGGALLVFMRIITERERINFKVEQARDEAERKQQLDLLKIKFFTNVSHEFRTPLTLILTPIEKLIKSATNSDQAKQMQMIQRNAKRLLNLVNELLEFRKIEVQELVLNLTRSEINSFVKDIFQSFTDLSDNKNIQFTYSSSINELNIYFDTTKLERILFNLLSNAFKFTPNGGSIKVELNIKTIPNQDITNWIEIKVTDTGIGIAANKHEKIFERFFQNDLPGNMLNQGSGIGLSLAKEFTKLHGGTISVESETGKGSCFTVLLPVNEKITESDEAYKSNLYISSTSAEYSANSEEDGVLLSSKPLVLIVEDNDDFRFYLKDNLQKHYKIIEAENGSKGWLLAINKTPDLIVSDVMMPEMDGIELCKKIKTDMRTSHIPVILLTARASEEQKIQGYETGADEYIIKPFNYEILEIRINNLIKQRNKLQKNFQKQIEINPSEIVVTSLDEKLMQKALDLVEKNIGNPDFSVEELSKELGMSRAHLYNKLISLTGKSPIEFIRILRLKRAAQLLAKSQMSVSEIAFNVGFNNPKYFSQYFKAEFNVLPSEFKMENQNKSSDI